MTSSFFINTTECAPGYKNVRDKPHNAEYKNFVESLWIIYEPNADKHFQSDAVIHFQERFWEMYLGATFLEHGFTINRGGDKGPEFYLSNTSKKIWIELKLLRQALVMDPMLMNCQKQQIVLQ